jgi:NB-ARC domain/TIR domain
MNFVAEMQRASEQARVVIGVLSEPYLESAYTEDEWTAAHRERKLLLVRVGGERPSGILGPLISVELVDVAEEVARERLLAAAERILTGSRAKPKTRPAYPRPVPERPVSAPVPFPASRSLRNLSRGRNPNFTGRDEQLAAVASFLAEGKHVALTGLGGVGKSRLALEYAHRNSDDYEIIWWIRAETSATLVEDLAKLAIALGLVPREEQNLVDAAEAARLHLEQKECWLLVFDDAPGVELVDPYLPKKDAGHVIVTSRNPAWRGLASPLNLVVLAPSDAVDLLRQRSGDADTGDAARELAEELGCLPLALEQAGAYVEESQTTLARYLDAFRAHQAEVLAEGRAHDYPASVAAAWELSFHALERNAPPAMTLLELLAFLAPDDSDSSVRRLCRASPRCPCKGVKSSARA